MNEHEISDAIDYGIIKEVVKEIQELEDQLIKENFGDLPREVIIATLKEKYPENFL
jgi:hypothetical protein